MRYSSPNGTGSPLPSPTPNRTEKRSAAVKSHKFLRRLIHYRHMDFEFALWQILYLFIAPQKVYRNFQYRKQTKDQFARDDPAFLVLLSLCLVGSSAGIALVLHFGFFEFIKLLVWVIFIDCIAVGLLIATSLWFLCNRYLRKSNCTEQDVEWGYAFDVHLNAFFPLLIILHVLQTVFYGIFERNMSHYWGNTLWLIAIGYYLYITFLGYSALPILQNTQIILYPIIVLLILYIVSLFTPVNMCVGIMDFYNLRVRP